MLQNNQNKLHKVRRLFISLAVFLVLSSKVSALMDPPHYERTTKFIEVSFSTVGHGGATYYESRRFQYIDQYGYAYVRSSGSIGSIESSSTSANMTVYPGVAFPVTDNGGSITVDASSPTFVVAAYQGAHPWEVTNAGQGVGLLTYTTWYPYQAPGDIQSISTGVPVYFEIRDSSYTSRDVFETGSSTITANVKGVYVYSQGGNTILSWDDGDDVTIWDGVPLVIDNIPETFDGNVCFNYVLSPPTTFSLTLVNIPTNP